ncbi:MAG: hypothetical protein FJ184_14910 [Gammaproteobacteria bacterium]|nr:hypothetical protein [Gammaproteobacteria bacterium]
MTTLPAAGDFRDVYKEGSMDFAPGTVGLELTVQCANFLHRGSLATGASKVRTNLKVVYRPTDRVLSWSAFEVFIESLEHEPLGLEHAAGLIHDYVDSNVRPSYLQVILERDDSPGFVLFSVVASA